MITELFEEKKSLKAVILCTIGLFMIGHVLFNETILYSFALALCPCWFFCIQRKANVLIRHDSRVYKQAGFYWRAILNMLGMTFLFGFYIFQFSGRNVAIMLFASIFYVCVDGFLISRIASKQVFRQ